MKIEDGVVRGVIGEAIAGRNRDADLMARVHRLVDGDRPGAGGRQIDAAKIGKNADAADRIDRQWRVAVDEFEIIVGNPGQQPRGLGDAANIVGAKAVGCREGHIAVFGSGGKLTGDDHAARGLGDVAHGGKFDPAG